MMRFFFSTIKSIVNQYCYILRTISISIRDLASFVKGDFYRFVMSFRQLLADGNLRDSFVLLKYISFFFNFVTINYLAGGNCTQEANKIIYIHILSRTIFCFIHYNGVLNEWLNEFRI